MSTETDTETVTIVRDLPCKLTDAEVAELRTQIVATVELIEAKTEEKKAITGDLNDDIKSAKKEQKRLCREVKAGEVTRAVECHEIKEYRTNESRIVRKDTGELVSSVTMKAEDLQTTLPGANGTVTPAGTKKKMGKGKKGDPKDSDPGLVGDGDASAGVGWPQ